MMSLSQREEAERLKSSAIELQRLANDALKVLQDRFPKARLVFLAELEAEGIGIAPIIATSGIARVTTLCRMVTTSAAEQLAMVEQEAQRKEVPGKN